MAAYAYEQALRVAEDGLRLAPDDAALIALRGDARAGLGAAEAALAAWRQALELDICPLYSTAFLLEREGRMADAADAWRAIVEWCESRGYDAEAVWPKEELERLLRGYRACLSVPLSATGPLSA